MTRYLTRDAAAVAAAVLGPLALAAVLLPWRGSWPAANVALLLVVAVVAVACLGNRLAGALAALSAAVWFDYFFTRPYERLTISHPGDVTTFALLLAVGVAVSQMAAWARRLKALIDVLDLKDCRFEYGKLLGQPPRLEPDGTVTTRYGHYPVDEFGFPEEDVELRTFSNGQYTGRFMLTPKPGSRPSQRARLVAVALADLAGHAVGTSPAHAA